MTREEIRWFFVKRPFLRPPDLETIKTCQTNLKRHEQLVWFVKGWLGSKSDDVAWEEDQ